MGYTTLRDDTGAVAAATALAKDARARSEPVNSSSALIEALPLLVEQVGAEAGVHEPVVCARALLQAGGDLARAVSLVRAWASTLPRLGALHVELADMRVNRRITPAFAAPPGGQFLGATSDYDQRLLDFRPASVNGAVVAPASLNGTAVDSAPAPSPPALPPPALPPPLAELDAAGLVAATEAGPGQAEFHRLLARGDTGALTAFAYAAIRGYAGRADPTVSELRAGALPVRVRRPDLVEVTVGEVPAVAVEVVLYRVHDGEPDARLTVGAAATVGRVERRAVAAAVLAANCTRVAQSGGAASAVSQH